ncbi:MAG: glutaminyl-peptide cyclotransferase, partial [Ferruginibacter sp.]
MKLIVFLGVFIIVFSACNGSNNYDTDPTIVPAPSTNNGVPVPVNLSFNILAQHPHDTGAYTQGLQLHDGKMYEGTGDYIQSSLRITNYKTGKVEKIHQM